MEVDRAVCDEAKKALGSTKDITRCTGKREGGEDDNEGGYVENEMVLSVKMKGREGEEDEDGQRRFQNM